MQAAVDKLHEKEVVLTKDLEKLSEERSALRQQCVDLKEQLGNMLKENSGLLDRITVLESVESKSAELEEKNSSLVAEKLSLSNKLAELELHCSELKSTHCNHIEKLEQETADWKNKAAELEVQLVEIKTELDQVSAKLGQEAAEKAAVQGELSAMAAQQLNMQRLSEAVEQLEAELESERASSRKEDVERLGEVEARLSALQVSLAESHFYT
jgi:chromosome segregation ATPase